MQPDSLINWALLAAAITDVTCSQEDGRLGNSKHEIGETVTQFALDKG